MKELGSVRFRAWDLGGSKKCTLLIILGHEQVRGMWRDYFQGTDAIIFMVDSGDEERFEETRKVHSIVRFLMFYKELHALLKEETIKNTPFLILANKIDLPVIFHS